jgi:hypothetical protein
MSQHYIAFHEMQIRIWATAESAEAALAAAAVEMRECGEDEDRIRELEVLPATPRLVAWVERHGGDESSVGWEVRGAQTSPYADLAEEDGEEDEEAGNYAPSSAADVAEARLELIRDKMGLNRAYWPGRPADIAEVIAAGQEAVEADRAKRRVRDILKPSGRFAPTTQELYALEAAVKVDPLLALDAAVEFIAVAGGARYVAQEALTWASSALEEAIKGVNSLDELAELLTQAAEVGVEVNFDLPTFGGEEPADTDGVWSWDADRLLVHGRDGARGWEIENR